MSILLNYEVWHNILVKDIEELTKVDQYLMRKILQCHSKVPIEFIYLETGCLSVSHIIMKRRLLYLQNILKRSEHELVRKVYLAQKCNPMKGDWCLSVKMDMQTINCHISDEHISKMTKIGYKKYITCQIQELALCKNKQKQSTHVKISHIKYDCLKIRE